MEKKDQLAHLIGTVLPTLQINITKSLLQKKKPNQTRKYHPSNGCHTALYYLQQILILNLLAICSLTFRFPQF